MEIPAPALAKLITKLERLWETARCEACGTETWEVLKNIYEMRAYAPEEAFSIGPVLPVIVAQCDHCGNTRIASAIKLGLIDPKTGALINGQE
jgi:hypothetical protein